MTLDFQAWLEIYEPGPYYFGRLDSPIAVPFQQWLYEDVLPSILLKLHTYQFVAQTL
ncbi:hypothetical protein H6G97_10945 [Nostoc flagelliforme FACHB-838]|uniref:Uncharacterized protein n=1 Tax=Nostoc flagelliforme FACHB-838 TaxID=2692904 RepID=A0ABR8DLZ6_9NOSO|nr:hypothetical protein [Nostoc flagelliforme FACHB-838]